MLTSLDSLYVKNIGKLRPIFSVLPFFLLNWLEIALGFSDNLHFYFVQEEGKVLIYFPAPGGTTPFYYNTIWIREKLFLFSVFLSELTSFLLFFLAICILIFLLIFFFSFFTRKRFLFAPHSSSVIDTRVVLKKSVKTKIFFSRK